MVEYENELHMVAAGKQTNMEVKTRKNKGESKNLNEVVVKNKKTKERSIINLKVIIQKIVMAITV